MQRPSPGKTPPGNPQPRVVYNIYTVQCRSVHQMLRKCTKKDRLSSANLKRNLVPPFFNPENPPSNEPKPVGYPRAQPENIDDIGNLTQVVMKKRPKRGKTPGKNVPQNKVVEIERLNSHTPVKPVTGDDSTLSSLYHRASVHRLGRAHRHRHTQRLEVVVRRLRRYRRGGAHPVGVSRRAVHHGVQRRVSVSVFRRGRGLLHGPQVLT